MKKRIMYISKKIVPAILFAGCFSVCLFAQETASQIELPDLTTVVTGSNEQQDIAPAPEFDDVLDMPQDSGDLEPVLPSASVEDETDPDSVEASESQKDIYAEGKIGGGYPASFTGDFQISRLYGADPFKISFVHDSASGFAGHSLSDGFNFSNTAIGVEKDFIRKSIRWGFAGRYEDIKNGLQSATEGIAANNQDSVGLSSSFLWNLSDELKLTFDAGSEFYYRFADMIKGSSSEGASRITVDPKLGFLWNHKGLELGFEAQYNLEALNDICNRGQFDLNLSWSNEKIKLFAQAGVVVGNLIGEHPVIVPFAVGIDTSLPVYFSDRKLNLSLSGGLSSERKSTSRLEREFKFSVLQELAAETTDWFGRVNLLVPLKSSFTGTVSGGYARTALGNGIWTPDYSDANPAFGLYKFTARNRNQLYTDFAFTWKYKIFAATAKYHANWIDIPVLENRHTVSVSFALQSQKGLWGVNLDTDYLLDAADNKPIINLEGYVQASSAVQIVLSVNDMIKLLGAEERMYAGRYVANSGNAMLLVKFLF